MSTEHKGPGTLDGPADGASPEIEQTPTEQANRVPTNALRSEQ
ncbi:hypothetical protein [Streptomyces sp. NBRC 109706]|nr:hypothetical protein [Streptomyces sp. NBRC 109706]